MKEKIAISLSRDVIDSIDKIIDGSNIRSRSQAIEVLIKKGLELLGVSTAFILIGKNHVDIPLRRFKSSTIIDEQIKFFRKNGIENINIVTSGELSGLPINIVKTNEKYNGSALQSVKNISGNDFVVMSGDTYNDFDLISMIKKHRAYGKLATIGLMSSKIPDKNGVAVLEGDFVIKFEEKPKNPSSNIINSGIYVFNKEVFNFMKGSIERDVLPELAKRRQLVGYFTMGEYVHFDD